ncbi:hypothetical protein SNE40_015025 [Patella caerulea]|uniref:Uncharacterized protein n=1 Tax=Patella caerulea TaxID=87958 RepID=A0AAN8JJ38_PATCE
MTAEVSVLLTVLVLVENVCGRGARGRYRGSGDGGSGDIGVYIYVGCILGGFIVTIITLLLIYLCYKRWSRRMEADENKRTIHRMETEMINGRMYFVNDKREPNVKPPSDSTSNSTFPFEPFKPSVYI